MASHLSKTAIREALRSRGAAYFARREAGTAVGLLNQGATCYMNSFLQAMFLQPLVRARVFAFNHSAVEHGPASSCVALQLQCLFAQLLLSGRRAVSTEDLTRAFGAEFSASQQHDAQELMAAIFDELRAAGVDVDSLFCGSMHTVLVSSAQHTRVGASETFVGLALPVRGYATLAASLASLACSEAMDGKWEVEEGMRVDATRTTRFTSLPPILCFHLKRFVYDHVRMDRVKVRDRFHFSRHLDAASLLGLRTSSISTSTGSYELSAILVHTGTAHGGHYFSFCSSTNDAGERQWWELNDARTRRLDEDEVAELTRAAEDSGAGVVAAGKEATEAKNGDAASPPPALTSSAATRVSLAARDAYMLVYTRRDDTTRSLTESAVACLPSAALQSKVAADNAALETMAALVAAQAEAVELRVFARLAGGRDDFTGDVDTTIDFVASRTSLRTATAAAAVAVDAALRRSGSDGLRARLGGEMDDSDNSDLDSLRALVVQCIGSGQLRLRSRNVCSGRLGATYGGREDASLEDIGLRGGTSVHVQLELRACDATPFVEFSPDDWTASLFVLEENATNDDAIALIERAQAATFSGARPVRDKSMTVVRVEGKRDATLASLWTAVSSAMRTSPAELRLIRINHRDAVAVQLAAPAASSSTTLLRQLGLRSSDVIFVERARAASSSVPQRTPTIIAAFDSLRNIVEIAFNDPNDSKDDDDDDDAFFGHTISLDLRHSVAFAKEAMASVLRRSSGEGVDAQDGEDRDCAAEMHLRRVCSGAEGGVGVGARLKDETQTLRDARLFDGARLILQHGRPVPPDSFVLQFYDIAPECCAGSSVVSPVKLCESVVPQSTRVFSLKILLAQQLSCSASSLLLRPLSLSSPRNKGGPSSLRVEKKGKEKEHENESETVARRKEKGTLGEWLRDDVSIRTATKRKVQDGFAFSVQRMPHTVERLTRHSLVLCSRFWTPGWPGMKGTLAPPREIVVAKNAMLGTIKAALAHAPAFGSSVSSSDSDSESTSSSSVLIAKWSRFLTGMKPLSFANARKLKWRGGDDGDDVRLSGKRFGFRSDHVLVYCDVRTYERAIAEIATFKRTQTEERAAALAAAEATVERCRSALADDALHAQVEASPGTFVRDDRDAVAQLAEAHVALSAARKASAPPRGKSTRGGDVNVARRGRGAGSRLVIRGGRGGGGERSALKKACAGGCGWDLGEGNDEVFCSSCKKKRITVTHDK